MSGLDSIVAGIEDDIIPGLQYSLASKRGAKYVKQRNSSTFYPATSNTYSVATGQRVVRVVLADSGSSMLDLSTVRIVMNIKNNDGAKPLALTGRHLACIFSRVTARVKGVITDDVTYYNRLVGMLQSFKPVNANYSDGVSQLGTGYSDYFPIAAASGVAGDNRLVANGLTIGGPEIDVIPAGASRTVLFDLPGISILNNHYLLPIGRFPLELVLELVKQEKDVCAEKFQDPKTGAYTDGSLNFQIDSVEVKADTLLLDSAVTTNIEQALVGGTPLALHLRPWNVTQYEIAPGAKSWNQIFSRAYSRLLSIFVNFMPRAPPGDFAKLWTESNCFANWHGAADWTPGLKPDYAKDRDSYRYQVQLGTQLYPNVPIRSNAESYYHLQKCVGQLSTGVGLAIGPTYRSTNFHLATDFEKVSATPAGQADFSGQNTKMSGEQMRLVFEDVTAKSNEWEPKNMYICANYDEIVQLRIEGVVAAD